MQQHSFDPSKKDDTPTNLPSVPATEGSSPEASSDKAKKAFNLGPRQLPDPAPDRIKFGSRLVLYKKAQTEDTAIYMTHIKGKLTFIFVMESFDPATAIKWKNVFKDRKGTILADRDGVVKDSRFLNDTEKQNAADVMVPSALIAAKRMNEAGIGLGIVTNQGGYQSGQMSFEDTVAINVRVIQQIANAGGHVDAVFICPFSQGLKDGKPGVHDARKPSPGMFMYAEKLAAENKVPVLASTGDQRTDGAAAQAAGQRFFAITGLSGRWEAELKAADKRGEKLPTLNQDPSVYREVTEFADVVEAILAELPQDTAKGESAKPAPKRYKKKK